MKDASFLISHDLKTVSGVTHYAGTPWILPPFCILTVQYGVDFWPVAQH